MAQRYGRRWSERAEVRAERFAEMSRPAWLAVADATGIGPGRRVLDVACGSGEFGALARDRRAAVAGIDAAPGMVELARRRLPGADLRLGSLEALPWPDREFDVVTGFNAFQFAPDLTAALAEARRVTRPGGRVAVCNWGSPQDCELSAVVHAVDPLQPGPPLVPRLPLGEPGVLEELAAAAGLRPDRAGLVGVPYTAPDEQTLVRDLCSGGNLTPAVRHVGADAVAAALLAAAAGFRRSDGEYRFANCFRYLISTVPAR